MSAISWKRKSCLLLTSALISTVCHAKIFPSKYNVYLTESVNQSGSFMVRNSSNSPAYVRTHLYKVISPGTGSEHLEEVFSLSDSNVTISPQQFTIPAHGATAINTKLLRTPQSNYELYRVELMPLKAKTIKSLPSVTSNNSTEIGLQSDASLSLITSYLINIHARNSSPQLNIVKTKNSNTVHLSNDGDIMIAYRNAYACNSKNKCTSLSRTYNFNLYPHQERNINIPQGYTKVHYTTEWMDNMQQKRRGKFIG